MGEYDDIIGLPSHKSKRHPPMSMRDRAAQFAPFAALTGYEDELREAERLTDERVSLSDESISQLNSRLRLLNARLHERPEIAVTCFIPDPQKEGGSQQTFTGRVLKLSENARSLQLADGRTISFEDILAIDGELFTAELNTGGLI